MRPSSCGTVTSVTALGSSRNESRSVREFSRIPSIRKFIARMLLPLSRGPSRAAAVFLRSPPREVEAEPVCPAAGVSISSKPVKPVLRV